MSTRISTSTTTQPAARVLGKLTAQGVAKSQFGKSRITRAKKDNSIISLGDDLKAAASRFLLAMIDASDRAHVRRLVFGPGTTA